MCIYILLLEPTSGTLQGKSYILKLHKEPILHRHWHFYVCLILCRDLCRFYCFPADHVSTALKFPLKKFPN